MIRYLSFLVFLLASYWSTGQVANVTLNFNNCDTEIVGNLDNPLLTGNVNCVCGVEESALVFNGTDNALLFDSSYTEIFQSSFTLSFYFLPDESNNGVVDILSVANGCGIDSALTIKYIPSERLVQVQMAKDFDLLVEMQGQVDKDRCWHHVVLQRDDKNYSLFLDGDFADNGFVNGDILLDSEAQLRIGGSDCQSFGELPFKGYFDEFFITERVLSLEEIFNSFQSYDQLITPDTTIFTGGAVAIRQFPSCANAILWTPSANVINFDQLEPVISPDATTTYAVSYDYGICTANDTLTITVIEDELVDCNALLLPNAFTPNNDGLNDDFGISNAFIIENLRYFEIFDRWGSKVFDAQSKSDRWDGTLKGKKVNPNVYLYKIGYTCKGESFLKTGSFTILR